MESTQIFQNVQSLEATTEGDDLTEMSFGEFLEGICCVAIFKLPDPFQPLHERLDLFFREYFLKPLKAVSRKTCRLAFPFSFPLFFFFSTFELEDYYWKQGNYIKTVVEKKKAKHKKQLSEN